MKSLLFFYIQLFPFINTFWFPQLMGRKIFYGENQKAKWINTFTLICPKFILSNFCFAFAKAG
ncbi:hypothetical protein D1164_20860 [Mariniphaga sediminis]|jgi:hypothetical protein|uniref:Uncharacterized protein n=1 Tax=Mariniphaga sediminis TaxID=1628158 RepID=A0A399CYN7_9BACT|nr:hypothetical protein D1164_20860 [Mariniphaga sediminis]